MGGIFKDAVLGNPKKPLVSNSPKFSINKVDFIKLSIHAGVLGGTTALTFLAEWVAQQDWGQYTPIIILVANTVFQAGLKWFKDNDVEVPKVG